MSDLPCSDLVNLVACLPDLVDQLCVRSDLVAEPDEGSLQSFLYEVSEDVRPEWLPSRHSGSSKLPRKYSQQARRRLSPSSEQTDFSKHQKSTPSNHTEVATAGSLTKEPGESHHGDTMPRITPLDIFQVKVD